MQTRSFSRERLAARLDGILKAPVALVIAEEGLGKSTLIRDYLEARAIAHLLFTARAQHAAPGELLRGIAATFGGLNPTIARASEPAVLACDRGDGAALRDWIREHLAHVSATIVLDELHHVVAEPRCVTLLRTLVEATQPRIRWVLAVRDATPLPIPLWLASGLCELPIESDELRVQPDELHAAFERAGIPLDRRQAANLYDRTAGWAPALWSALSTRNLDGTRTRERVYDDLVDAALRPLSEEQCDRVFECAAIGRLDDSVVAALECGPDPLRLLASSELVHPQGDGWQAFHEPSRQRLALRLGALPAGRRAMILERAAAALEHVGRRREALELFVRGGDPNRILAVLERRGFDALDRGEADAVARALAALDEPVLMQHPIALAQKAAIASLDESFDVSEAWFCMAMETARDHERREIVIRYGMDLVRRGRDDVIAVLEKEAARGDARTSADSGAALWALLGTAYVQGHRNEKAREAAGRALVLLPGVADDAVRARVLHQASYVALNDGDFDAAKQLAQRALARAEMTSLYDLAARALSVLFNVAMLHDEDVAAARDALLRLEDAGRKAGNDALRLYAILNAYAIEVDAGEVDALERLNRELGDMHVLLTPTVSEALLPAQALRAAWAGRFEHACDLLAPGAEKLFDDDRTAYRWAEVAAYAAAAGKKRVATDAIRRCRAHVERLAADPLSVRGIAYVALAEALVGDERAAAASIAAARRSAHSMHVRIRTLVEAIAAFIECRRTGTTGIFKLEAMLDALEGHALGGVARFIGRLPTSAIESYRPRYKVAG